MEINLCFSASCPAEPTHVVFCKLFSAEGSNGCHWLVNYYCEKHVVPAGSLMTVIPLESKKPPARGLTALRGVSSLGFDLRYPEISAPGDKGQDARAD